MYNGHTSARCALSYQPLKSSEFHIPIPECPPLCLPPTNQRERLTTGPAPSSETHKTGDPWFMRLHPLQSPTCSCLSICPWCSSGPQILGLSGGLSDLTGCKGGSLGDTHFPSTGLLPQPVITICTFNTGRYFGLFVVLWRQVMRDPGMKSRLSSLQLPVVGFHTFAATPG